ncbi:MAG: hypothetical protein K8T25_04520 [Planctomycetia bacterium]|nr:hypothetical protein [Planctomycetia bacterium]
MSMWRVVLATAAILFAAHARADERTTDSTQQPSRLPAIDPYPVATAPTPEPVHPPATSGLPTPDSPPLPLLAEHYAVESTWYLKADYFHWNERSDGADFVNEDGVLWTLGYARRAGGERFRGELFAGDMNYDGLAQFDDGSVEPLSSTTGYFGLRGEYEWLFESQRWQRIEYVAGVGTRFWIRDLPNSLTAEGDPIIGYQETWWTIYPYLGLETKRSLSGVVESYGSARVGLTAITLEHATVNDVMLYPKLGLTTQWEAGIRGPSMYLSACAELMTWEESAVVRGWRQPMSSLLTLGIKTGISF